MFTPLLHFTALSLFCLSVTHGSLIHREDITDGLTLLDNDDCITTTITIPGLITTITIGLGLGIMSEPTFSFPVTTLSACESSTSIMHTSDPATAEAVSSTEVSPITHFTMTPNSYHGSSIVPNSVYNHRDNYSNSISSGRHRGFEPANRWYCVSYPTIWFHFYRGLIYICLRSYYCCGWSKLDRYIRRSMRLCGSTVLWFRCSGIFWLPLWHLSFQIVNRKFKLYVGELRRCKDSSWEIRCQDGRYRYGYSHRDFVWPA